MSSRGALAVALLAFACAPKSSSEPVAGPPNTGQTEQAPGQRRVREAADGCPRRFDVAMIDGPCELGSPACSYPEASCECVARPPCSGVDWGDEPRPVAHVWSCNVEDPDIRRADGCPAKLPSEGRKCADPGKVCLYSPYCGGTQSTARCVERRWELEQDFIDPPPSMER